MLVLSRNVGQSIEIGDGIVVTLLKVGRSVRVGIQAPQNVPIRRTELPKTSDSSAPQCPTHKPDMPLKGYLPAAG